RVRGPGGRRATRELHRGTQTAEPGTGIPDEGLEHRGNAHRHREPDALLGDQREEALLQVPRLIAPGDEVDVRVRREAHQRDLAKRTPWARSATRRAAADISGGSVSSSSGLPARARKSRW